MSGMRPRGRSSSVLGTHQCAAGDPRVASSAGGWGSERLSLLRKVCTNKQQGGGENEETAQSSK